MGLDIGADDYITKPFRIRELQSRIRSVLRRAQKQTNDDSIFRYGNVVVNITKGNVTKNGEDVFLTALEYRLLLTLMNNEGHVLTRNQLIESIWDVSGDFVNDNTLTVYIKRLREKIEDDPQNPQIIKTVRGMGYQI
jgi:DNA-binding response OmpR family regulator